MNKERFLLNIDTNNEVDIYNIYPIAWITKSQVLMDFISLAETEKEFFVADFASGEHNRVPTFFLDLLPKMHPSIPKRIVIYCIDLHGLRLDSLMGKLEESNLLENTRVVHTKLETMDEQADFRPSMIDYLKDKSNSMTWLDHHLMKNKSIPKAAFSFAILNNDVVGYLHEYYKEYSDATLGLQKVYKTLKKGALLVVTMPCSLYTIDNVKVLESIGFQFLEGKDIDLADGSITSLGRHTEPQEMSRLRHYSFLIFIRN
jgi:hypothetical protein